jgi:hypothetical protein
MLEHEPIPSRRGQCALPATVVASHLESCAGELAAGMAAGFEVGTAEEFAEVAAHLLAGQRSVARTLAGLAGRVRDGQESGTLATVPPLELEVLSEVLQAAAKAVGYSADALTEAGPSFESLIESAAPDTRL